MAIALLPVPGRCDAPPSPAPTMAPLPATVSAEDEFAPTYQSETGSSNIVNLRAQIPYDDATYVFRLKLPIVTSAPGASVTGAGDLALWDLAVLGNGRAQWLVGLNARVPTANDSLGSNKYSLGPAFGYRTKVGAWSVGFFNESFFSLVGPSWYPPVGKTKIQPIATLTVAPQWSVGLSTMKFTYDWVLNRWTEVPLGLRVEKQAVGKIAPLGGYLEAERNLARAPDTPGWTFRALLRWTFAPAQSPSTSDDDGG
ncbi:MAG: hypothetical protein WA814_06440 [Candidatus Baltobacteraceae bacterium]